MTPKIFELYIFILMRLPDAPDIQSGVVDLKTMGVMCMNTDILSPLKNYDSLIWAHININRIISPAQNLISSLLDL